MKKLKHELEREFGVPVYSKWDQVPKSLDTRTGFKQLGVKIPKDAKPDAIKNSYPSNYFFLFRKAKYLPQPQNHPDHEIAT
jgi:hypothetical protein